MRKKKYPSDISRVQFEQIRPLLERARKRTKPATVDLYEVFCGVLYLLKSGCQLVAASDIEWLQASGNYVNLSVRGHDYPLRSTIAGVESKLDPRLFVRIHRSYIVNLDHLASIEPLDTGDARVHLKDGTVLPCSHRQRDALRGRVGVPA